MDNNFNPNQNMYGQPQNFGQQPGYDPNQGYQQQNYQQSYDPNQGFQQQNYQQSYDPNQGFQQQGYQQSYDPNQGYQQQNYQQGFNQSYQQGYQQPYGGGYTPAKPKFTLDLNKYIGLLTSPAKTFKSVTEEDSIGYGLVGTAMGAVATIAFLFISIMVTYFRMKSKYGSYIKFGDSFGGFFKSAIGIVIGYYIYTFVIAGIYKLLSNSSRNATYTKLVNQVGGQMVLIGTGIGATIFFAIFLAMSTSKGGQFFFGLITYSVIILFIFISMIGGFIGYKNCVSDLSEDQAVIKYVLGYVIMFAITMILLFAINSDSVSFSSSFRF